ncbi:MAG: hypothetical protein KAU22_06790 [Desulfuromonadales bacterium]|nr:hypothetical protein [Desulfuromonadales bacterium]
MDLVVIYKVGLIVAVAMALLWSFVFDKKKPATAKEFVAKLIARALLIVVLFVVLMGFCYLAFGMFQQSTMASEISLPAKQ